MNQEHLHQVIESIGNEFRRKIQKGARHYLEVNIGAQAEKMGYDGLKARYQDSFAIVPLKQPQKGMKVRIEGRTFVNYAEYDSGIAVPGYVAAEIGHSLKPYVPNDSMICNFT